MSDSVERARQLADRARDYVKMFDDDPRRQGAVGLLEALADELEAVCNQRDQLAAEAKGLALMILTIRDRYLQAHEALGGDSELFRSAIRRSAEYVDGPFRAALEGSTEP